LDGSFWEKATATGAPPDKDRREAAVSAGIVAIVVPAVMVAEAATLRVAEPEAVGSGVGGVGVA
jgi:hypothetical protein